MISRAEDTVDRQIKRIGSVRGENDTVRVIGSDNASHALSGSGDNSVRLGRLPVGTAPGRSTDFLLPVRDRIVYLIGFGPTCSGVVQVDAWGIGHASWGTVGTLGFVSKLEPNALASGGQQQIHAGW